MKELKDKQIKVRVTEKEKALVDEYCERKGLTVSDLLRLALFRVINQEEKDNV